MGKPRPMQANSLASGVRFAPYARSSRTSATGSRDQLATCAGSRPSRSRSAKTSGTFTSACFSPLAVEVW